VSLYLCVFYKIRVRCFRVLWLHRHDPNLLLLNYEDIVKVSIFARVMLTDVTHCEVPIYFLIKYKLMIVKLYIRVTTHMLIHIIFK